MADYVERYSGKASDELEKQIRQVYKQAAEEVQKKLDDFIRGHKARNAQMLQMVSDGKMSKQDYQKWMRGQVFQGDQWKQKLKDVTDVYVHADEKAREIVGGTSKNVFMEAANYTAYDLEKGMRGAVAFDVYDAKTVERLLKKDPKMLPEWKIDQPKDYKWNEKRVRNAVAQGIIQGESVEEVGDRLTGELATSNATKMDMFARTAINGAQNAGRMDRLHEAEEMGIEVRKKWLATLDQRTRDTHQALDGQEQPIDEPFVVDGMKIDYPGDPFAPPELVYNCRCTLTYVYPKYQHLQHNHERRDQLNDKNIENMTYYEWLGLASKNDRKQEEPEPEEPSVGRKIVQGKDITETWERRPDQFKFEIDDVINAQGFDGFPQVLSRAEFDAAVKAANGGKGFIAQRTYSAPDQAVLDAYRAQLYGGKWYVDCSVGTAAYGQGMYATGDFNGQITENMQKATDFYIGLNEQKGNSVAATEVFTLQADAKIADYEKLYSEFTKYGMETQEKNAEIRRTAVKDASKELADKILKDAGFEEEYAKKFFYGNLSLADVDWEEMGKAYKQLGSEGVKKMQELQSEYYKKQTAYVDDYVKEKSIDEIKDIGAFATALGYDAIEVKNHGIYDTTEVVVLNRTKCIFLDPASKEEPKQTEEAMPDLPTQPSNPSESKDASFVETEEKEKVKCPYTDEMSSKGYVGLSAAESDEFIKNHHNKRIVGKKGSNTMDGSQSRRINTAFRNDETPTNPADVKLVQKLDAEINKNELPQDMTLFRGVSLDAFSASGVFDGFEKTVVEMSDFKDASGNIDFDKWGKAYEEATDKDLEDKLSRAKKLIGTTIEDKGYMQVSASSQRNIFAASEIGLQIHAPEGTKAYISDYQGESEIILGRGTSYRVLDATIATTTLENGNQIKNIQLIVETVDETESKQKSNNTPAKSVEQKSEYTKSEEEAIHEYTTSSYSGVNSALREGTVDNYKDVKDIVDKIDSAMEKTVVNDGTVTSRGASMADLRGMFEGKRRSWFEDPDNLKSLEGQTASFKSYLSTTKGDTVAEPYKRELQWHFTTEGQVHGIDAEQFASSSVKSEREIVFDRDAQIEIEKVKVNVDSDGDIDGIVEIWAKIKENKQEEQPAEKPQKKEKEESKQTEEKKDESYQYHATTAKAIIGIAEKGLQPNRGHVGKGIYFADNAKDALDWVDTTSTGGKTVLRVSEEYLEKEKLEKYSASETGYGLAESLYDGKVPLEYIQIKVNDNGDEDDWWSLAQYLKNRKSQYNMLDQKTKKKVDKLVDEEDERRLKRRR